MSDCSKNSALGEDRGAVPVVSAAALVAHEPLVRWVVRQQWRGGLPFADALHEGRLGLWQALRHYDPARGTRFSTYAVPAIQRTVWAAVAAHRAMGVAAVAVAGTCSGGDVVEPGEVALAAVHREAVAAALAEAIGQLSPRAQLVITWHYGLDGAAPQTFAAIGGRLGVTRQRVQQVHRAAVLWLAHPSHSLPLRRLLGRDRRTEYQQTLARQRQWARARRGPRRPPRRRLSQGRRP
jgi:RNA polymerase sigma factor (sigma-70 family)